MPSKTITFEFVEDGRRPRYILGGDGVSGLFSESERELRPVSESKLADFHSAVVNFIRRIDDNENKVLSKIGREQRIWSALTELLTAGNIIWEYALGDEPSEWLGRLNHLLTAELPPEWWKDPATNSQYMYETRTLGVPDRMLPLDLLPLGERSRFIYGGPEDVVQLAAVFGGFVSRVRYAASHRGVFTHPELRGPRAVLSIQSDKAPAVSEMSIQLSSIEDPIAGLWGPHPYPNSGHFATPDEIARSFTVLDRAPDTGALIDVVHFYSHGYTWSDPAATLLLNVDWKGDPSPLVVRGVHFEKARKKAKDAQATGPIVLLNACHSLGHIGSEWRSTALALITTGTRAILGVRDEIPGAVAVQMSSKVLQLMNSGMSVGSAAVGARWHLLNNYMNPLGLLFATFGDIDSVRSSVR
ncbi:hypothetical protein GCM10022204_13440 [Microlunatus aurantiacus]|uniref:CHAT domain-containing protein n=1 Tax=Microlunatus aurantiacus TaxID=446786 RepID=A0ABP7D3Y8_9ACTN